MAAAGAEEPERDVHSITTPSWMSPLQCAKAKDMLTLDTSGRWRQVRQSQERCARHDVHYNAVTDKPIAICKSEGCAYPLQTRHPPVGTLQCSGGKAGERCTEHGITMPTQVSLLQCIKATESLTDYVLRRRAHCNVAGRPSQGGIRVQGITMHT